MKVSWRYILPALALAGLMAAALVNPALLITYLVEPAARILWLGLRMLMMVDQQIYWTVLIFAALILVIKMIPARQENPKGVPRAGSTLPNNRVAYWEGLIEAAREDPDARMELEQALQRLNRSIELLVEGNGAEEIHLMAIRKGAIFRFGRRLSQFLRTGKPGEMNRDDAVRMEQILKRLEDKMESEDERAADDN